MASGEEGISSGGGSFGVRPDDLEVEVEEELVVVEAESSSILNLLSCSWNMEA